MQDKPNIQAGIFYINKWRKKLWTNLEQYLGRLTRDNLDNISTTIYNLIVPKAISLDQTQPLKITSKLYNNIKTTVQTFLTSQVILDHELSYLCKAFAGNLQLIKAETIKLRPWIVQTDSEWVLCRIIEAIPLLQRTKVGTQFTLDVMSGTPSGKEFNLFLPDSVIRYFWIYGCGGKTKDRIPYPKMFVGLYVMLLLKPGEKFYAEKWYCTQTMIKRNRIRVKYRLDNKRVCKKTTPGKCVTCHYSYDKCKLATTLNGATAGACPGFNYAPHLGYKIPHSTLCLTCMYIKWKRTMR